MSKASEIVEAEDAGGKPPMVVREANVLKDGSSRGPPTLFHHASMQRIRHCCQNLNLFPYLLYSFDNSKSHPIARKVHLCLGQFLEMIVVRIFFLYRGFGRTMLRGIRPDECQSQDPTPNTEACEPLLIFQTTSQQKRKQSNPLFLTLAVYCAPLFLAFQLMGLFSLMIFGKYTPGFIFLISALIFLGCISLKILFHETVTHSGRSEKIKTQ